MTSLRSFKIEDKYLNLLTANEKRLLPILTSAVKITDEIFKLQEDGIHNGANFYPLDAIKSEIETEALKNPKILSPFTTVERNKSGKLVAIEYHIKYSKYLKEISKLIKKTATICQNSSFKKYLNVLSTSLTNGDFGKIDIEWLHSSNSNIDFVIGPYERYLDKLFFMKRAFQGYVAIIDRDKTKQAKLIRDILYTTIGDRPLRVVPPAIVDIRIIQATNYSGLLGEMVLAQQHLPADTEMVTNHGSRIICYMSAIDYKFEKLIYPIFNALFEKTFKSRYSKDLLKKGNYYFLILQAIAQHLHRYRGSRRRLRDLFPIFDEANSVVAGIQHAKYLILKGVMDQKELEAIMICSICWVFSERVISWQTNVREGFFKGDALTLNFLMSSGTIQEKDGLSWPNFAKMFFEIENLASIFTRILENGTPIEAQEFLSKYLSFDHFTAFDESLSKIKPL